MGGWAVKGLENQDKSAKVADDKLGWIQRRKRDSNPRYGSLYSGFQDHGEHSMWVLTDFNRFQGLILPE